MRPQKDEPCVKCKNWDGRTKHGCKIGRYNSTTMVIWGVCGFSEPKLTRKTEGGD